MRPQIAKTQTKTFLLQAARVTLFQCFIYTAISVCVETKQRKKVLQTMGGVGGD